MATRSDAEAMWERTREDFAPDGALRDVYVRGTSMEDWNRLFALAGVSPEPGAERRNVHFDAGRVRLLGDLCTPDEIELSFDPAEVDGPDALADLLGFVAQLGRALGKIVEITPRNLPQFPFLRFDPADDAMQCIEPQFDAVACLEGPVESIDGRLVLRIPLSAGGAAFVECARGISRIVGEELEVTIPDWLAEKLGICEGSTVVVDNREGKFTMTPAPTA